MPKAADVLFKLDTGSLEHSVGTARARVPSRISGQAESSKATAVRKRPAAANRSQLESNLISESILDPPMASVHRRYACMGCTSRRDGAGEPTYFNDYQSATTHYARSSLSAPSPGGGSS